MNTIVWNCQGEGADLTMWNCQGEGADLTKEHLEELFHCFLPKFLFLSETKNNRTFLQDAQVSFGYDQVVPWARLVKAEA